MRFHLILPLLLALLFGSLVHAAQTVARVGAPVAVISRRPLTAAFDRDYKQSLNGVVLHFRVRGTNPTNPYLLILHGGPGVGAHMYYPWGASLENVVNVVYLDQRGGGESDRLHFANPDAPQSQEIKDYTIGNLVADIEAVREFLKLSNWFVLGHSWGGMLGIEYVATHPEHVLGYIHMDGLLSWPITQKSMLDGAETSLMRQLKSDNPQLKAEAESQLERLQEIRRLPSGPEKLLGAMQLSSILPIFAQPEAAKAYDRRVTEAMISYHLQPPAYAPEPLKALAYNPVNHLDSRDERMLLSSIKLRVLVINGRKDPIIPPEVSEITHDGIKSSKFLLLDDCGHFPFSEQPEKTTQAVLDFIRSCR